MAIVKFTQALSRFFPELKPFEVEISTIPLLLESLDQKFPGLRSYIVNDSGELRKHVNIFLNGEMIDDRVKLSDAIQSDTEVYIMQALSGG